MARPASGDLARRGPSSVPTPFWRLPLPESLHCGVPSVDGGRGLMWSLAHTPSIVPEAMVRH
eukprot:5290030-Pyramimonas_sp.AAC.1